MHEQRTPTGAELADDVATAAANVGISRAFAYRLIKAGELDSFTLGRRRLISRDAQRRFIARREAAAQ